MARSDLLSHVVGTETPLLKVDPDLSRTLDGTAPNYPSWTDVDFVSIMILTLISFSVVCIYILILIL